MALIDWPEGLPTAPQVDSYEEKLPDNLIRTQMDSGPGKTRRRSTVDNRKFTMSFLYTAAQVEVLEAFILDDLAGGVYQFNFPHPRTGVMMNARFSALPVLAALGGLEYVVKVEMEKMP